MILKKLISEIEEHTGKEFDLSNKRHFFSLNSKIERLHQEERRKLYLIEKVMKSSSNEDSLFNSKIEFIQKKYK